MTTRPASPSHRAGLTRGRRLLAAILLAAAALGLATPYAAAPAPVIDAPAGRLRGVEEGSARVEQTIPRDRLWLAQTPQMFRLALLQRALAQAGAQVTDEASAVEALGLRPLLVPGAWENLKITWPADFALAERLLATR